MRLYPDYFRVFNRCPKDSFSVDSWSFIENARGSFLSLSYDFFNCLGADSRLHKANILIFLLHFFPYDERTKKARIPVNYISCNYRRNDCRRFYFYPIFCPNTWIISAVRFAWQQCPQYGAILQAQTTQCFLRCDQKIELCRVSAV